MRSDAARRCRCACCRCVRARCVHVVRGRLRRRCSCFRGSSARAARALIRRWSARLLRMLNVETRVHGGTLGACAATCWSSPTTSRGSTSSCSTRIAAGALHRQGGARALAGASAGSSRGVGHAVHRARAAARHASRQRSRRARRSPRGDVVAVFPEGTTTDGTTLLPFNGSLLQPIVDAAGHVQPIAIRYRTPTASIRDGAGVRRRHDVRRLVLARVRRARARRRAHRAAAACRRAARIGASSRARPRRYPNGFGCTGARAGTWYTRRSGSLIAGQRAAPQAARVEHQHVGREHELERRPVAADDGRRAPSAVAMREPRREARAACARRRASRGTPSCRRRCRSAAACSALTIDAQPVVARRGRRATRAARRRRARAGTRRVASLAQHRLDFARQRDARRAASTRQQARVHQQPVALDDARAAARAASRAARRDRALRGSRRACRRDAASRWPAATVSRWKSWLPSTVTAASPSAITSRSTASESGTAIDEIADEPQPVARAARSRSGRAARRTRRGSPGCRRSRNAP